MTIRIGIWDGGASSNDPGTISWAGGVTDFAQAPFTMVLEKIEVVNLNPGARYEYADLTGDYTSIDVVGAAGESGAPSASGAPSEESEKAQTGKGTASAALQSSSTQTGVSWTASAGPSEVLAQGATSAALKIGVVAWQYVVCGVLIICGLMY
jgi:hypothetical protein